MRTQIAYAIIGAIIVLATIFWLATAPRRKAEKLRRRGIKSHNRGR